VQIYDASRRSAARVVSEIHDLAPCASGVRAYHARR